MRKLVALSIVLTLAGATKSWALLGLENLSYDGSLEVRGNSASNESDQSPANDHRGDTATRLRLGLNADVTENVTARIELIRDPRIYGSSATHINDELDRLVFHNAYIDINNFLGEGHKLRLGRQFVGNPGDLVWNISPTDDDNLTANSIDGALFQCRKWDFMHTDLFIGKASDDDGLANTDSDDTSGDLNLSALDIVLPTIVPGAKVNIGYLWGVNQSTASVQNENKLTTIRVGINGGVMENMLTYRAEYFQNGGKLENGATETDYKGSAIDLGLGLNAPETSIGGFSGWLNYVMGSGDDNSTDSDDEAFHDFTALGLNTSDRLFGEIFGKSNTLGGGTPRGQGLDAANSAYDRGLTVINIGAQYKPSFLSKSSLKVDYFILNASEDTIDNTDRGDKYGNELDIALGYDYSDNVNFEVGYAMLSPDDALLATTTSPDEDITKTYARAKVRWGGESK